MKTLLTLLISLFGIATVNAQSAQPENPQSPGNQKPVVIQHEPQKESNEIVMPKRVVERAPSPVTKTMDISEIQKIQEEKKKQQAANPNQPAKRVTSQEIEQQELQKKHQEYEQLKKSQPE